MLKQGDILLIPIPFTDLSSNKKRPVLVISNDLYNNKTEDILVAAITSNIDGKEYEVMINNENMASGTLKVESCVRADKIYTLSQSIVVSRFGSVKPEILEKVREMINSLIE